MQTVIPGTGAFLTCALLACTLLARGSPDGERPNILMIAIDDLRPQFGRAFGNPEVKTPHLDAFFMDGNGTAMQRSYVQIAVCGPSRSSVLTSRRPDSTHVGVGGSGGWCWCTRGGCAVDALFMTLPT